MNWIVLIAPSFLKDLASLPAKVRQRVEEFVFVTLPAAEAPQQVGKIEKLKGYSEFTKSALATTA
jgi:mRNA interferase RelE/StbE